MSRIIKKLFTRTTIEETRKKRRKTSKKFEVIFHCRRILFPSNHCLLIFRFKRTQIPSVGAFSHKKKGRKTLFNLIMIKPFLLIYSRVKIFIVLINYAWILHTLMLPSRCASCFRNLSIFLRRFTKVLIRTESQKSRLFIFFLHFPIKSASG